MRLNKVGIEIIVIFEEFVRVVFDDWQAEASPDLVSFGFDGC